MSARERLGSSTRLTREVEDDLAPESVRHVAGKRTLLDPDAVATAPGKLTRLDTDPYAMSPAQAIRYARAIDRKAEPGADVPEDGALASAFAFLDRTGAGEPLPRALLRRLSHALAADLARLRVHTSRDAANAAAAIGARAFTIGCDIYFAAGAYDPTSAGGIELIAHEARHVADNARRGTARTGVSRPGDTHERDADTFADTFLREPGAGPTIHARDAALRAVLRGDVITIAEILALDTGAFEIQVDASLPVRGRQTGATVQLDPHVIAAGGDTARYVIAHELVHLAQRALPASDDHRAAEAEATALGLDYARGHRLARPQVGLAAGTVANDDGAPADAKLLASPPKLSWAPAVRATMT